MTKFGIRGLFKKKSMNNEGANTKGDLGLFLSNLRKERNLKQQDIADYLNVTNQTISKWEKNISLPDDDYKYQLCKFYNISLEELYLGQRNYSKRRKDKFSIFLNGIFIVFLAIFLPLFILLVIFFFVNFNAIHIYRINNDDTKEYNQVKFKGLYIETKSANFLYIGYVDLNNYDIKDSDVISINILDSENSIAYFNSNKNIFTVIDKKYDLKSSNIILNLILNNVNYYSTIDYSDALYELNDITSTNGLVLKSNDDIISSLENMDFVKDENNFYILNIKTKNNDTKVSVDLSSKEILFVQKDSSIIKHILFRSKNNALDVIVYQNDSIRTVVEKYVYYYNSSKLECNIGSCVTTKEVLKTMEKYINLLIVD